MRWNEIRCHRKRLSIAGSEKKLSEVGKWRLTGYVVRSDDGRWFREILKWYPIAERRRRGRPRKRWDEEVGKVFGGVVNDKLE